MKKGFTLVELLVVVVVIITLMAITFRLAGVGGEATDRNQTIARMQRLENCLSGYYAAYGSYPPVKLYGSRDYTYKVDGWSKVQSIERDEHVTGRLKDNWDSVEAACRSQPVAFNYPYPKSMVPFVEALSDRAREKNAATPRYTALYNRSLIGDSKSETVFKFGLMSYLLPRFLVTMMKSGYVSEQVDSTLFSELPEWTDNNQLPCRFDDGAPYSSWNDVNKDAYEHTWKIAALPSQVACARWLPNLEGIVSWITSTKLYGVEIRDTTDVQIPSQVYFVGGYGSQSTPYKLNEITVKDHYWNDKKGTWEEFYYYSPPPHQNYRLWSAGPNNRTFPPWVTEEELGNLSGEDRKTVQEWIEDDIVHMSN